MEAQFHLGPGCVVWEELGFQVTLSLEPAEVLLNLKLQTGWLDVSSRWCSFGLLGSFPLTKPWQVTSVLN